MKELRSMKPSVVVFLAAAAAATSPAWADDSKSNQKPVSKPNEPANDDVSNLAASILRTGPGVRLPIHQAIGAVERPLYGDDKKAAAGAAKRLLDRRSEFKLD